jgi:hypothetical protein
MRVYDENGDLNVFELTDEEFEEEFPNSNVFVLIDPMLKAKWDGKNECFRLGLKKDGCGWFPVSVITTGKGE